MILSMSLEPNVRFLWNVAPLRNSFEKRMFCLANEGGCIICGFGIVSHSSKPVSANAKRWRKAVGLRNQLCPPQLITTCADFPKGSKECKLCLNEKTFTGIEIKEGEKKGESVPPSVFTLSSEKEVRFSHSFRRAPFHNYSIFPPTYTFLAFVSHLTNLMGDPRMLMFITT